MSVRLGISYLSKFVTQLSPSPLYHWCKSPTWASDIFRIANLMHMQYNIKGIPHISLSIHCSMCEELWQTLTAMYYSPSTHLLLLTSKNVLCSQTLIIIYLWLVALQCHHCATVTDSFSALDAYVHFEPLQPKYKAINRLTRSPKKL